MRTIFLALIMVMLYHFLLTRPIFQLTESISRYQHDASDLRSLPDIPGHEEDELGFLIDSFNDLITNLENQKLGLQQREKQLRIVLDSSPNLVFAVNSKMDFTLMNLSTARFYGVSPEELLARNYYLQHQKINISEAEELFQALISSQSKLQNKVQYEQALTNHQGQKTVMHMTLKPFLLDGEDSILVIATDITARVEAEERVENLAYYDSLTHLPNRNQVQQILFDDVHNTVDNNGHGAVLFIDIDDFKRINDTLGHSVGDELLLQIANMMNSILANNYHLARLGGDEFILSMPNLAQSAEGAIQIAADFSQKILESIKAPIELDKHLFTIGASIGIAIYPDASTDTDKILQFADTAMYKAKAAGRNTYCVFETSMADEASRMLILESEIRRAIENHEFTFFLQPLVQAKTHEVVGAEALIRWRHPEKGMVMPGDFIPFLETSPMLNKVGNMMLDQICGFISACKEAGRLKPDFRVSINVGANEVYQSNFVELVASTLERHHVSGKCIEMEITESVALSSFEEITATMQKLKAHGISFALDDFGTGYSSLNYLKRLPVDKIKIDKSFIDDIPHNTQDAALVGSVIQIANNLKLGVVVEGIEHAVQAEWFESRYDLAMQGYLFNRPIPPSEFVETYLPQLNTTSDK